MQANSPKPDCRALTRFSTGALRNGHYKRHAAPCLPVSRSRPFPLKVASTPSLLSCRIATDREVPLSIDKTGCTVVKGRESRLGEVQIRGFSSRTLARILGRYQNT